MGRPALGLVSTTLRLPPVLLERIDKLTGGGNKRGVFIREAIERELARRERAKP